MVELEHITKVMLTPKAKAFKVLSNNNSSL